MTAKRFDRASENRQAVHLGLGLITVSSALILSTVWFLPTTPGGRSVALAMTAGSLVASVALARLPWERLPTEALLVFPVLGLAAMTVGAALEQWCQPRLLRAFHRGHLLRSHNPVAPPDDARYSRVPCRSGSSAREASRPLSQ